VAIKKLTPALSKSEFNRQNTGIPPPGQPRSPKVGSSPRANQVAGNDRSCFGV